MEKKKIVAPRIRWYSSIEFDKMCPVDLFSRMAVKTCDGKTSVSDLPKDLKARCCKNVEITSPCKFSLQAMVLYDSTGRLTSLGLFSNPKRILSTFLLSTGLISLCQGVFVVGVAFLRATELMYTNIRQFSLHSLPLIYFSSDTGTCLLSSNLSPSPRSLNMAQL